MSSICKYGLLLMTLLTTAPGWAQNGSMMDGSYWENGMRGGMWMPVIIIAAVVVLIVWMVRRKDK